MSTDKELLELAAKAVGIDGIYTEYVCDGETRGVIFNKLVPWNPLDDDGDALRLAVKLLIEINHNHFQKTVDAYYSPDFSQHTSKLTEAYGNDPYAATRRAIVKAAAEIGRGIK